MLHPIIQAHSLPFPSAESPLSSHIMIEAFICTGEEQAITYTMDLEAEDTKGVFLVDDLIVLSREWTRRLRVWF